MAGPEGDDVEKDYEALRQERLATVDPEYRMLLEVLPELPEVGVEGMRAAVGMAADTRPVTEGVDVRDIEVPGPDGPVPTRIYTPHGVEGPLPVVMHVHFGGFVAGGGLGTLDPENTAMAAGVPCVVVAPDFRLPPEHPFPAGLDDCWAVLNWIADHGAEEGWDANRIAVGGGCTGGNFAAVLALMARDAGGPALRLQFLWSWIADARCDSPSQREFATGYGLRYTDNKWVVAQYVDEPDRVLDWRVSPILAESLEGVAPALIAVGEWDILRDEDLDYAARLEEAGVEVRCEVIPRMGHFPNPDEVNPNELSIGALREAFA